MNATATPAYEWKDLPWTAIQRRVFKLQTRIYRAEQRGNVGAVHRLQRLLLHSWSAKCLAVRRVTQDNQGKKAAGVDGVKLLTPQQRRTLVADLSLTKRAQPVRRVWIPKPHTTTEQRPLGIPVMHDRAAQALAKLALEPEWEAKFEPNSYGFRPGRSCHDAIAAIFLDVKQRPKYVLDADIRKCFDRIDHAGLLAKLGTFPTLRRAVHNWLKAGVLTGEGLFPTEEGVPQGGVISPLLANVALHGMETAVKERLSKIGKNGWVRPGFVRYADDFVILHPDRSVIEEAQQVVAAWLGDMSLELKPEKTQIVHTLLGEQPGFDFLGFTVRQFPVGKYRTGTDSKGKPLGFKTLIKPSRANCKEHQRKLGDVVRASRAAPQVRLIATLNPIIRGWSNYYSAVVSAAEFDRQDSLLFLKLRRWAGRHHGQKQRWRWRQYWRKGWRFQAKVGENTFTLRRHRDTAIRRHVKVAGTRSPYDGGLVYWSTRLGRHPELAPQVARLLKRQQGRCALCGLLFTAEDVLERDHIIPKSQGGSSWDENQQLLHRHCHDTKSAHDKGQVTEEPCAEKSARTVLNERRAG